MHLLRSNYLSSLLTLLFLGFFTASNAQPDPMKWGKIPPEDLSMTTYEADPDADALVLGAYEMVSVNMREDYSVSYEIHVRIKILSQEGLDRANIRIPYGKKERIIDFKAQTINQGEITKVRKKDVFEEEVTKSYSRRRFTFPNVQVGSIIEYRYILESPYAGVLDTWYFQEDIPVRWSECRFSVPLYIEYVMITNTNKTFDIKEDKRISIGSDEGRMYRFVMKDMRGLEEEKYITTMTDYFNNIQFQAAALTEPSGVRNRYWKDWPDLIDKWWTYDFGGKQIKNKSNHKKILKDTEIATTDISDPKEKAVALYNFIKNSYTWNERFSDYVQEKKLNIAYEKKTGNSAEINMSLLACLQAAEIEAYPIRISTRSHGRIQKLYPIVSQFNHIAVLAKIDGEDYLLDAIDKNLVFGTLHPESLNLQGLLLKRSKENPTWIDLIPSKTTEVVNINLQIENDEPVAELTGVYTGYRALSKRYQVGNQDEEDYIENRLGDLYDFEVESVEFNTDKPERFAEVINLKVEDAVTNSGDNIYINPFLMEQMNERIFTLEKRAYPVDIASPYVEKYILNFTIPDGYEVAELPENIKLSLPDDSGSYLYMVQVSDNNKIQLRCEERLKKPVYLPEEYEALKGLFDMIFEKEAEQIILKKK